ncbi:MAG: hypothetical protein AB1384_11925 [Actinomycetota bacterium]
MSAAVQEEKEAHFNGVSDSLIRIEIITHFHRNPGLVSTIRYMADATGRDLDRVERQMNKLVQLHILEEYSNNGKLRYRYVPPHSVAAYLLKRNGS